MRPLFPFQTARLVQGGGRRAEIFPVTFRAILASFGRWLAVSTVAGALLAAAGLSFPGFGLAAGNDGGEAALSAEQAAQLVHKLRLPAVARDGLLPVGQAQFTTSATASVRNGVVTITGSVRASVPGRFVVDFETHAPNGVRVDQQWFDDEPFRAGETRNFTITWRPPASAQRGTYAVRLGVFAPGPEWAVLYHWNNAAAAFVLP